jgi:Fanconi-associated nuclease 1
MRSFLVLAAGGLPDLVLWHPARKAAQLVEVKGPRDRLSDQQLAWMQVLGAAGIEVGRSNVLLLMQSMVAA